MGSTHQQMAEIVLSDRANGGDRWLLFVIRLSVAWGKTPDATIAIVEQMAVGDFRNVPGGAQ